MFRKWFSTNFHFNLKERELKIPKSKEDTFTKEVKFNFHGITGCFKMIQMRDMYGHFNSELKFENIPENIARWSETFTTRSSSYESGYKSYKVRYNLKMYCPQKADYGYFVENYIQKTANIKPFEWYFGDLILDDDESIDIIVALNIFEITREDGTFYVSRSPMDFSTKLTWKQSSSNFNMKQKELKLYYKNPYLKGSIATQAIMGPVSDDGHFCLAFNPHKQIVFISCIQWPHDVRNMAYMVDIRVSLDNNKIIKSNWSGWFNGNEKVAAVFDVKFSGMYKCPVYKSANTLNGYGIGLKLWKRKDKGMPIKIEVMMKLNSLEDINGFTSFDIEDFKKFDIAGLEALGED